MSSNVLVRLLVLLLISMLSTTASTLKGTPLSGVSFDIPKFVLLDSQAEMLAISESGSNVTYKWRLNVPVSNVSLVQWEFCFHDGPSNSSLTFNVSQMHDWDITVEVLDAFGSNKSTNGAISSVFEVTGFKAELAANDSLFLFSPDDGNFPMGDLSAEVRNSTQIIMEKKQMAIHPSSSYILIASVPSGSTNISVSITTDVSKQVVIVDGSGGARLDRGPFFGMLGEPVTLRLLMSSGRGFQYVLDFGDDSSKEEDLRAETFAEDIRIEHIYSSVGSFNLTLRAIYEGSEKVSFSQISVVHLGINVAPIITLPDGSANVTVSIRPDLSPKQCFFGVKTDISNEVVVHGFSDLRQFYVPGVYTFTLNCSGIPFKRERNILVKTFGPSDFKVFYADKVAKSEGNVMVEFSINLFDVKVIPPEVYFSWDFGDGSARESGKLQSWLKTHSFRQRGFRNISLTIATDKNSQETFTLPIQIGLCMFTVNNTFGIQARHVFGFQLEIPPIIVNVTLYFGDRTNETIINWNTTQRLAIQREHVYLSQGVFYPMARVVSPVWAELVPSTPVRVRGANDAIKMTVDAIIRIPPGKGFLAFSLTWVSARGEAIVCDVDFGVDGEHETLSFTFGNSSEVQFERHFLESGKRVVVANCSGNETVPFQSMSSNTHVISECYGSTESLFNIDSPTKKKVSEQLIVAAGPHVKCINMTSIFYWNVDRVVNGTATQLPVHQSNTTLLVIPPRSMEEGYYIVTFYTFFKEVPSTFLSDNFVLIYEKSPLVVRIKGGTIQTIGRSQQVTMDGITLSYDPDARTDYPSVLKYAWSFSTHDSQEEAIKSSVNRRSTPAEAVGSSAGVLVWTPGCFLPDKWYLFSLEVSEGDRKGYAHQIIYVDSENLPRVDITCKVNCNEKVNAEFSFKLESECLSCNAVERRQVQYKWQLFRQDDNGRNTEMKTFDDLTETGTTISTMAIRPYSFNPGESYLLTLTYGVTGSDKRSVIQQQITVNYPPFNGTCTLSPTEGYAVYDRFRVVCENWIDEGNNAKRSDEDSSDHLFYRFILRSRGNDSLLYAGGSRMTTKQVFNVGDEEDDYKVMVTVRVFDQHNGMAEVNLTAKVRPPTLRKDEKNNTMKLDGILGDFDRTIDEAVVSGDLHEVFRIVESAGSMINAGVIGNSSAEEDITSDQWLAKVPADVSATDNTSVRTWGNLWSMNRDQHSVDENEQEQISSRNSKYFQTIESAVNSAELVSIDTVFMASSSVRTLLEKPRNVPSQSLEKAVNTVGRLGNSLPGLVSVDMSDTQVEEVLGSVIGAVDKTFSAITPSGATSESTVSQEQSRKDIAITREFSPLAERSVNAARLEQADIHDDERAFLLTRAKLKQKYFDSVKEDYAKKSIFRLQDAIDKTLESAATFMVDGQNVKMFRSDTMESSVERKPVQAILNRDIAVDDVLLKVTEKKSNRDNGDQVVSLKTVKFNKNPFAWGKGASRITSPALFLNVSRRDPQDEPLNGSVRFSVSLPNSDPVRSHRVKPKFIKLDRDQMIYRKIQIRSTKDKLLVTLKPSVPFVEYDVYFRSGQFPTSEIYDYKSVARQAENETLQVECPPGNLPSDGTVYLALKPRVQRNSASLKEEVLNKSTAVKPPPAGDDETLRHAEFDIQVAAVGCPLWSDSDTAWEVDLCQAQLDNTSSSTTCSCDLPLSSIFTIATTFYLPVNTIDFSTVFAEIDLQNNASVFAVVFVLLIIYAFLLVWARRKDKTDVIKGFPNQSVMYFLMAVPEWLGELQYLRVWHDNSGKGPMASWFLHKIAVEDIQKNKKFIFKCDKWLGVDEDDGQIERLLPVTSKENLINFSNLFYNNARKNVTDSHIWFSVLFRPQRSHFTRVQRLSCCACLLFLSMICNALFYQGHENVVRPTTVNIGFLRLSVSQVYTSIITVLIVTPVELLLIWLFKKSKPKESGSQSIETLSAGCFLSKQRIEIVNALLSRSFVMPKGALLPHFCIYIAWAMVILCISASAFFVFLLSQQWGKAKSEEWLTSFLLTFFESLAILDPLKVILMAVIFAMFVHKLEEDSDDLNKDELKTSRASEFSAKLSDEAQKPVEPLAANEVQKVRVVRLRETKTFEVLKEIVLYLIFLVTMASMGYTNRDPRSFSLKNNLFNNLVNKQQDGRLGLLEVRTVAEYFEWLNKTAFPVLFHETYPNGTRRHWSDRFFIQDLQNLRVGPPRLRQVRRNQGLTCLLPTLSSSESCYNQSSHNEEVSDDFCIGWKPPPCAREERAFKLTSRAWTFASSSLIWGMPVIGVYSSYGGGGYIAQLNVNLDVSTQVLKELFAERWIDRSTRLLTLDFTIYNANTNLFCFVSLMAEFPGSGGTITTANVSPFRLYQYAGSLGYFVFWTEILFLVLLLVAVVRLGLKIVKHGAKYLCDFWHIVDFMTLLSCFAAIGMYGLRKLTTEMALQRYRDDPRQFINFQQVMFWDNMLVVMVGLVTFTCTIRTVKILGFSRRLNAIIAVLANARRDLFCFSIMFSVFLTAFVGYGYFMFGQNLAAYKTVLQTCETLMTSLVGKPLFKDFRHSEPMQAQIYFCAFVFFFVFVLLTMFQVILNQSIAQVRADKGAVSQQHEMLQVLLSKLPAVFGYFSRTPVDNSPRPHSTCQKSDQKMDNEVNRITR